METTGKDYMKPIIKSFKSAVNKVSNSKTVQRAKLKNTVRHSEKIKNIQAKAANKRVKESKLMESKTKAQADKVAAKSNAKNAKFRNKAWNAEKEMIQAKAQAEVKKNISKQAGKISTGAGVAALGAPLIDASSRAKEAEKKSAAQLEQEYIDAVTSINGV